jgi:hypothetical protein
MALFYSSYGAYSGAVRFLPSNGSPSLDFGVPTAARYYALKRILSLRRPQRKVKIVSQRTRSETTRHSEDRLQDHPSVRDERHDEPQHAA